ncbi:DUF5681 domain-containing protein [Phenylobacterium sp.]|uniref:DUF5681 domain-containing protein n=1 Tax=Phenylobacterium sp. TaxID=1871053 RepID=UPI0028A0CF41|nr:DUF5681 domain-containing protein [Phenylobacterium sp.]
MSGYGKPPPEHRFKKGQSGNPKGRPKKKRPPEEVPTKLRDVILAEAWRQVSFVEAGQTITEPMVAIVMRQIGLAGAKKDKIAGRMFIQLTQEAEASKELDQARAPSPMAEPDWENCVTYEQAQEVYMRMIGRK